MTTRLRISIGIVTLLAFGAILALTTPAGTSPIIKYASVIVRPGNPTLAGGYQATPGVLYGRSDSPEVWVKSGAGATAWLQLPTSGNGFFPSFGSTLVNGDLTVTGVVNDNGWTTLVQAASQDVTNAQDADSNTFTFAVTTSSIYMVECDLEMSGQNIANDAEFRFATSAGTITGRGTALGVSAADAAVVTLIAAAAAANTNQTPVGVQGTSLGLGTPIRVRFEFTQNTSNATFKLQFGNNVTGVGIVSRMLPKSQCRWKQLA